MSASGAAGRRPPGCRRMGGFVALCCAMVGVALLACDPGPPGEIGVRLSQEGAVALRIGTCRSDQQIEAIQVRDLSVGKDEEPLVWRIEARKPSAVTHFVVGEVPTGFVATISLAAESLDNESKYAAEAEVSRSRLPLRTAFSLREL